MSENSVDFSSDDFSFIEIKKKNETLLSQVSHQQKCIQLLENYRNYFILFCNTCKCGLNIGNKLILNELEKDYRQTFDENNGKQVVNNSNIHMNNDFVNNREEIVNTINSDNNVNHLMIDLNENRLQLFNSNEENVSNSLVDIKTEDLSLNNSVINEEFVFGSNLFNNKRKAKSCRNKKVFKCELKNCGKLFKSKRGFELHIKEHNNNFKEIEVNRELTSLSRNSKRNIKRPVNAFFLYCNDNRPQLKAKYPNVRHIHISKILSKNWNNLSEREKNEYLERGRVIREEHAKQNPGYRFCPKEVRERKAERKRLKELHKQMRLSGPQTKRKNS